MAAMQRELMAWISRVIEAWTRFWFESDGRAQVRLFRIVFPLLLFAAYAIRSMDLELFYGEQGLMPLAGLSELLPQEYRFTVFRYFTSHASLWIANFIFLGSLLSLAFGWLPQLSAVVALFLHTSFLHRNPGGIYGADMTASFFLWFLCLADSRLDRDYRPGDLKAMLGSMAWRLGQIQLCIIYGYSGLGKLRGYTWWNGNAVWHTLGQVQLARWDFSWMAHFPFALTLATFLTFTWEIYFPALIWIKALRKPVLIVGIFLHLGIAVGLNLPIFGALMVLSYAFFLERAAAERILAWLGGLKNRVTFSKVQTADAE